MDIDNLKEFAEDKGLELRDSLVIIEEASRNIAMKYRFSIDETKENFDKLLFETEEEAYRLYLKYEKEYGSKVISKFIKELASNERIMHPYVALARRDALNVSFLKFC